MIQNSGQGILDGLGLWIRLATFGGIALSAWVGYKVNTELFKEGGVMDRLEEQMQKIVRIEESKGDHERRIRDLEQWRFRDKR